MKENPQNPEVKAREAAASELKRKQDLIRAKHENLKTVDAKHFQAEYVKAQAEEICSYLRELQLMPFNAWYSKLAEIAGDGKFMSQFYLTYNEHDVIEPDYERIETLVLPDQNLDEFNKRSITFA